MGMYRCWVCWKCKVVSYHHLTYCPSCPNKLEFIKDYSDKLVEMFPTNKDWTPAEWSPEHKQPWIEKENDLRTKFFNIFKTWALNNYFASIRAPFKFNDTSKSVFINEKEEENYKIFNTLLAECDTLDKLEKIICNHLGTKYNIDLYSLYSTIKHDFKLLEKTNAS